ncbi:serine/threonine-protein kinase [Streptomyces sp. NPDC001941]|uniref:serine/threonine-protein kinase n=1 Tax=Streptomyces sp. NPDC001941 TaxID=3154659 RepID=UPI00331FD44B
MPENQLIAGRYRLLGPLGEGGMGVVWRARDEVLGREVAVKEVRAPSGLPDAEVRRLYARLEREAWAAARITHRNVVTVYDVQNDQGRPWIVMELVRGLTLSEELDAEGPMSPRRAAHIGAEVLAALRAAHEAGVLHRDVKPGNVLLSNDGRVVLTDFGIAVVEGTSNLTMTGELIGSPEFLAPERALGRPAGPESDLWSLGVLLYAAVEGNSPFRLDTPLNTLRAVVDEELPPPRRAGALAPVIEGLLRKEPQERMTAAEAEHQLRIVGAGGTPRDPGAAAAGPYAPTMTAPTPPLPMPVPVPSAGAATTAAGYGPASDTSAGAPEPRRDRKAGAALAAGIALLLLALAALAYVLLNGRAGGDGQAGGGASAGSSSSATVPGGGATTGGKSPSSEDPSPSASSDEPSKEPSSSAPPRQTVQVYAQEVRGSYSGTCPPPDRQAPAFSGAVTVGRVPATVEYRWATESGEGSGDWKTLRFPAGGEAAREVNHTVTAYPQGGTRRDRVRIEVRSPVPVNSNWVSFSVTCEEDASPSGDASSPGYSATPQP